MIVGTVAVGNQLQAGAPVFYESDGVTPFTTADVFYQWYRSGVAIPGAVGAHYMLQPADLGKVITVRITSVTAPGRLFRVIAPLSAGTAPVAPGTIDPTGSGSTFTISATGLATAKWSGAPTSPTGPFTSAYKWYREGVVAPIATTASYQLTAADTDKDITVVVSIARAGYATLSDPPLLVNEITVQAPLVLLADGAPAAGAPSVGATLSYTLPTFLHAGTPTHTVAYQWLRAGAPIPGATGATYVVSGEDEGERLSAVVTVSASRYLTTAFEGPQSDPVLP